MPLRGDRGSRLGRRGLCGVYCPTAREESAADGGWRGWGGGALPVPSFQRRRPPAQLPLKMGRQARASRAAVGDLRSAPATGPPGVCRGSSLPWPRAASGPRGLVRLPTAGLPPRPFLLQRVSLQGSGCFRLRPFSLCPRRSTGGLHKQPHARSRWEPYMYVFVGRPGECCRISMCKTQRPASLLFGSSFQINTRRGVLAGAEVGHGHRLRRAPSLPCV